MDEPTLDELKAAREILREIARNYNNGLKQENAGYAPAGRIDASEWAQCA